MNRSLLTGVRGLLHVHSKRPSQFITHTALLRKVSTTPSNGSPRFYDFEKRSVPPIKRNPSVVGPTIAEGDIIDDSADVLFTSHEYACAVADVPPVAKKMIFPALRFSPDGTIDHCQFDLNGLKSVPSRDLLVLEPEIEGEMRKHGPVILPRKDCIIVSISHIKCVIFHDTMIMLEIDNPLTSKFATLLGNYLRHTIPNPNDPDPIDLTFRDSFEMRALEGILRLVVDTYARRLRCYSPVIANVLREMSTGQVEIRNIQRLLPIKDSLISFERAADELVRTLAFLIRSEDDRRSLFLTARRNMVVQNMHKDKKVPLSVYRFHVKDSTPIPYYALRDCELLLESFERESIQLRAESINLQKKIQAAEDFTRIVRDARRNMLITLQAKTALGSLSVAAGALVTGIFGMNLLNGMETAPNVFYFFAGVSTLIPMLLYKKVSTKIMDTVYWKMTHQVGTQIQNRDLYQQCLNAPDQGASDDDKLSLLKHVRASIAELGDIQDDILESIDGRDVLTRDELRQIILLATKEPCDEDLLNVILSFYGDGTTITTNQLRVMLCDTPSSRWTRIKYY